MDLYYPSMFKRFLREGVPDAEWRPVDENGKNFFVIDFKVDGNGSIVERPHPVNGEVDDPVGIGFWLGEAARLESGRAMPSESESPERTTTERSDGSAANKTQEETDDDGDNGDSRRTERGSKERESYGRDRPRGHRYGGESGWANRGQWHESNGHRNREEGEVTDVGGRRRDGKHRRGEGRGWWGFPLNLALGTKELKAKGSDSPAPFPVEDGDRVVD